MTDEAPDATNGKTSDFLGILEDGVKKVLANKKSTSSERVSAISAGVKIAMVRYKISGDMDKGFFD